MYAIDKSELLEYTIEGDTSGTIFQLGMLDAFEVAYVQSLAVQPEEKFYFSIRVVSIGLKGWKNFKNRKGENVPFITSATTLPNIGDISIMSNESLKLLSSDAMLKLANKILEINIYTDADKKK